ncbi:GbpC/Spa domain-containing protein, partial [Enterococcus faecalis]
MKQHVEVKKRYKMYKKGKHWVRAAILFAGVAGVMSVTTQAYADELPSSSSTETVITTPETPPADSETTSDTPKDATSQLTIAEGVAFSEVTTENTPVVENNTTVSDETIGEAQPAEPIGKPTEIANPTASGNQATTIPKEFETPDVDKAVDEAKKDPNITVVEKPAEDLGNVSSKDLDAKEKEVDQLQKEQAKKIAQQAAELKAKNEKIAKENAEIAAKNQAEKERYEKEVAEYNKHKNENGYVKEPVSKNLVFDQSVVTKDTKISSITGGKFIKAADFNKVNAGDSKDIFTKLRKDMGGKATGNFQNSFVKEVNLGANGG